MSKLPALCGYGSASIDFLDGYLGPMGLWGEHPTKSQLFSCMSSYGHTSQNNMAKLQELYDQIRPLISPSITNTKISGNGIVLSVADICIYIRHMAGHWGCHFKHILCDPKPFIDIGAEVKIDNQSGQKGTTLLMTDDNILDILTLLSVINDDESPEIKEPAQ
jgi:hypothetical protein